MMLLVKAPVPVPSVVLLSEVVGSADVLQQTPLKVTEAPPSSVIFPPLEAVVEVMAEGLVVLSVGVVGNVVVVVDVVVVVVGVVVVVVVVVGKFQLVLLPESTLSTASIGVESTLLES